MVQPARQEDGDREQVSPLAGTLGEQMSSPAGALVRSRAA